MGVRIRKGSVKTATLSIKVNVDAFTYYYSYTLSHIQ